MFENGKTYLNLGQYGLKHPGSWILVIWLVVLAFIVGQTISGGIILTQAIFEGNVPVEALGNDTQSGNQGAMALIVAGLASFSAIPFLITYNQKHKFAPWGLLGLASIAIAIAGFIIASSSSSSSSTEAANDALFGAIGASPVNYAILLLSFWVPFFALLVATRIVHKRTARSVITAAKKIRWGRIIFGAIVTWAVLGGFAFIFHQSGMEQVDYRLDEIEWGRFVAFALVSLALMPIQSATEEIIFRGYLNQAFGHLLKNKWLVFTITSLMFMSLHLANPESTSSAEKGFMEHALTMSGYFLFGYILCVIVYFEGGLEAAIGIHAANNLFAAIMVNYEGSVLPTPSVFLAPAPESSANWGILIVLSAIALALFFTRKRTIDMDLAAVSLENDVRHL